MARETPFFGLRLFVLLCVVLTFLVSGYKRETAAANGAPAANATTASPRHGERRASMWRARSSPSMLKT